MSDGKEWKIVLTKPGTEKKVCKSLLKKEICHFYPGGTVSQRSYDLSSKGLQLFERYVFVHITSVEELIINRMNGVSGFIYWHNQIAVIKVDEINLIKSLMSEYREVEVRKVKVNPCSKAEMVFLKQKGEVSESGKQKAVCKVFLPSLGFELMAEFNMPVVRLINANQFKNTDKASQHLTDKI